MNTILCATRGGQGSRVAQAAAVRYAREHNAKLIFVYVIDDKPYVGVDDVMRPALKEELSWIGSTLLKLAQSRSLDQGVPAEVALLSGSLMAQLCAFARAENVSKIMLGAPRGTTANIIGDDAIEKFVIDLQGATNVSVELVRPDYQGDAAQAQLAPPAIASDEATSHPPAEG